MRRLLEVVAVFLSLAVGLAKAPVRLATPARPEGRQAEPAEPNRSAAARWRRRLITVAVFAVILAVGGFVVAVSGIMPIKASSGHWAITAWFLNFSMSRSVSTHSMGIKTPSLDEPHLVLKGARHFDIGCRPCHGSPNLHNPRIAQAMTPHPPYLPSVIPNWEPEELYYIVKHGVKFTGMPAWPAQQRDDEVWAVVAFLLELPELDADEYRALARGDPGANETGADIEELTPAEEVPQLVAESCARCHDVQGLGQGLAAFPRLAGQSPAYLTAALNAFAAGDRHSGMMEPIAAGLDRIDVAALSRYYANLEPAVYEADPDESSPSVKRGAEIAQYGIPQERVPACVACHGRREGPQNPFYPVLAGQYADYLVLQLELFQKRHRGGSEYAHLMHEVVGGLTPDQMRDVAAYYESLAR